MDSQQYLQTVLESRALMTSMLHIISEQELMMAQLRRPQRREQYRPQNFNRSSFDANTIHTIFAQMMQPTPVIPVSLNTRVPTLAEIEAATRTITYGEIENPINSECPITHETFENNHEVTQLCNCGHIFNSNSILQWFNTGHQCPVCRYDIRSSTNSS